MKNVLFSGPAPDTNLYDELGDGEQFQPVSDDYDNVLTQDQYDSIGNDQPDVRSQGYEGLDQSDLAIQPQPHDYVGLATQPTTEEVDLTSFNGDNQWRIQGVCGVCGRIPY